MKEYHIGIVTRNIQKASGLTNLAQTSAISADTLRGAVYFEANTLFDGEYPVPADPSFGDIGMFWVPLVGASLLIEIEDSLDNPRPRYVCSWYNNDADIHEEFKTNYPQRKGWITSAGHQILFDDTEGKELLRIKHALGSFYEINEKSDVIETILGIKNLNVTKDLIWQITEKFISTVKESNQTILENALKTIGGTYTKNITVDEITTVDGKEEKTIGTGKKVTINTGDDEVILTSGNHIINISAGNIEITTLSGTAKMGNVVGSVAIDASGKVDITGTAINLGLPIGQVLTTVTAPVVDTITGAPHIGVPTVKAG